MYSHKFFSLIQIIFICGSYFDYPIIYKHKYKTNTSFISMHNGNRDNTSRLLVLVKIVHNQYR